MAVRLEMAVHLEPWWPRDDSEPGTMALPIIPPELELPGDAGVPLSALAPGRVATIIKVDTSSAEGRRLLDLGFLPGTEIRVARRAPLGDPIAFYLRGGEFCLRGSEAARIRVRLVARGPNP